MDPTATADSYYLNILKEYVHERNPKGWADFVEQNNRNGSKVQIKGRLTNEDFSGYEFRGVEFYNVDFSDTSFRKALFCNCLFKGRCLFTAAKIEGTKFEGVEMHTVSFDNALLSVDTGFIDCVISQDTTIISPTFNLARFSPGLKQTFEYCNRKRRWQEWYNTEAYLKRSIVKFFWQISNYGRSLQTIIISFLSYSLIFSVIYFLLALCYKNVPDSEMISGLIKYSDIGKDGEPSLRMIPISYPKLWFRSFYFSIVTMTTLGFGDIHAGYSSFIGYILLSLHVILGYIILGSLVTYFSISFSSDGPAALLLEEKDTNLFQRNITFMSHPNPLQKQKRR